MSDTSVFGSFVLNQIPAVVMEVDVAVIGGGISGLTAAYQIHKKDPSLRVVVFEAKDRVGGRTLSVELKTNDGVDTWDLGGQWVGRCQPHIMTLLEELGLQTHQQYISGRKFMQLGGDKITSYSSVLPSLPYLSLIDLHCLISKCDWMSKQVDMADPYACKYAKEWDSMTVDTFLKKTAWTQAAIDTIESAVRCMLGIECSQMSLLYFIMYVTSAGNLHNLTEASEFTAQEFKIVGGAQQVSQKLATILGDKAVLLNQPVKMIQQNDDNVKITTENGLVCKCSRVIVATPPNMTNKLNFEPLLPSEKIELLKRMPVSNLTKVIITYKEAFWREAGLSGEVVTNGGLTNVAGCDTGPICIVYDATSAHGSPAIVAFLGASQAIQWRSQDATARRSAVLKSLCDFFGPDAAKYIEYREKDWGVEPYTEGSPVCCVSPGAMPYFAKGLRHPFKRIHFAGTESATQWCGYMSGAVQAGLRAAFEVLYHLRPQSVSTMELSGTIYGSHVSQKLVKKSSKSKTVLKVMIGAGALSLGFFFFRKSNFRNFLRQ